MRVLPAQRLVVFSGSDADRRMGQLPPLEYQNDVAKRKRSGKEGKKSKKFLSRAFSLISCHGDRE
jgi:hypothetical protein